MEKVMEDVARKYCGIESTQKYCEAHELTLSGHPWNVDSGEEAIKTRILIGNLIMTFKSKGKVIHPKYYKYLKKGAKGQTKNGLVSGQLACTSSKTEILNKIGI